MSVNWALPFDEKIVPENKRTLIPIESYQKIHKSTITNSQVDLPGCVSQRKSNRLRSSREVWDQKGRYYRILSSHDSRVSNIHARGREARGMFYSDFFRFQRRLARRQAR